MRIRDKILVENGYITKAKVKWWGGIDYQYPYLWKENKGDKEYEVSWGDPRGAKVEKENKLQKVIQAKKRIIKKQKPIMG